LIGSNPEVDYLSREDYKIVSTKKYPVFHYSRDEIYDLFQQYEKMKAKNSDYDSMDRTLAILRCAKKALQWELTWNQGKHYKIINRNNLI